MSIRYSQVQASVGRLALQGWSVTELVQADGYPIMALTDPGVLAKQTEQAPSLLIVAGVHGEEPGAVAGLVRWLDRYAASWVGRLRMHVVPCLNPWGIERGIRFGAHGQDLNREFDRPKHPTVKAFTHWIRGLSFDLFMDLHEDCDFDTMYLYELLETVRASDEATLGRRILDMAKSRVPLSHGHDVGGMITEHGMLGGTLPRSEAAAFEGRPIAIEVYAHHTPHVVTVETPGLLELDTRAELHVMALELACKHLTKGLP